MSYKTEEELQGYLKEEHSTVFDPLRPPWTITVYKKASMDGRMENKESAVFLRGHHAMVDGTTLYATVLPLFFDMKLLPRSDPQFRKIWTRSESGLSKVAREMDANNFQGAPLAFGFEPFHGGDERTRKRKKTYLSFTESCQLLIIMLKKAAGYLQGFFVVPYALLT